MKTLAGVVVAVVGGVVFLVLVAILGLVGLRTVGGRSGEPEAASVTTTTAAPSRAVAAVRPVDAELVPDVTLRAGATEFEPPVVITGVRDGDVLVVRATGFLGGSTGSIAVCGQGRCGPNFPVNFDGEGSALIQYQVDLDRARCAGAAATATACRLEVEGDDVTAGAALTQERSNDAVSARIVGSGNVRAGEAVEVTMQGVDEARVRVLGCERGASRRSECRPLTIRDGRVVVDRGIERLVLIDRVTDLPVVSPLPLQITGLRPSYDAARLTIGLALGGALLVAALLLVRRTEWREPASVTVWAD